MKTALIFPGQGSQYVGMGQDFCSKYKVSMEIYDELDLNLRRSLTKDIFSGEEESLSKTENSQPSIMATSIAIFKALEFENLINKDSFECVAGHSLGEYSALVVNDCLDFKDAVKLLKIRSKAMQESMPLGTGGMIALIGCSDEVVLNAIEKAAQFGRIYIANDNAIGQVVLSGQIESVKYILNNSKELKIRKAIKLPVSAPFHCKLIENASVKLESEIYNYEFKPFKVPLYSNVTSNICSKNDIQNLLVEQIISKVRWRETVENMIKDGFNTFIEIGPGNVLTNLVKRISKDVQALSVSKLEDLDKLAK